MRSHFKINGHVLYSAALDSFDFQTLQRIKLETFVKKNTKNSLYVMELDD